MDEERLIGLALFNIFHKHRTVQFDELIDSFAGNKKRYLDFVLQLIF